MFEMLTPGPEHRGGPGEGGWGSAWRLPEGPGIATKETLTVQSEGLGHWERVQVRLPLAVGGGDQGRLRPGFALPGASRRVLPGG